MAYITKGQKFLRYKKILKYGYANKAVECKHP